MSDDNEDFMIEFFLGILFVQIMLFLVFEEVFLIVLICIGFDFGEICCICGDIVWNCVIRLRFLVDLVVDGGQFVFLVMGLGFWVEG